MDRRTLLRHLAAAAACLGPASAALAGEAGPAWTYQGPGGPAEWGRLSPDDAACGSGREQSPVDLSHPVPAMLGDPVVAWKPVPLDMVNTGHTLQVNCADGGTLTLDGTAYALQSFDFHHPSEHTVDGTALAMEIHFVHRAGGGGLAILAVLIRPGGADPTIETIWQSMPAQPGQSVRAGLFLDPTALLPRDGTTWRYAGSLTAPPCSETVSWAVYRRPITASPEQIDRFARLFPNNARPTQPLNRRKLLLDIL